MDANNISKLSPREQKYYKALMEYRDIIAGNIRHHADALDASSTDKRGVTTHMADVGSDNSRHEIALKMMTDDGDVLEMINDAIQRLFDHEFGKCHDCGKDISEARLEAKPYALYCIKCKSIREKHNGRNPFVD